MMKVKYLSGYLLLSVIVCCSAVFADEVGTDTTTAKGGNQIIVSPIDVLLDLGEIVTATALVVDEEGNPIEGHKLSVIPQSRKILSTKSNSYITNKSGYIHFTVMAKQQGESVISITDGIVTSHINVAIRNLIRYILPYFYGDMQLSLINPSDNAVFVKIQFNENSDRLLLPIMLRLEGKEMNNIKLSEELNVSLKDGWAEVYSTETIFGGVWTNKGYLRFSRFEE